ncbi:ORF148 [Alphabaculovirus altermyunipunctae]|uniref:ORF148 n=1 Tax=Mythimna unipuncta nucleopolyhedrovirus TaxID=447897 RepID=A0A346TPT4_9ABAC|nr:ORF148 [Mythimna unipuncta nucleopolyhedrovirus]AXU41594.1 ORF148 [Mythimna unipuncta nucleopolyhedrovirus]
MKGRPVNMYKHFGLNCDSLLLLCIVADDLLNEYYMLSDSISALDEKDDGRIELVEAMALQQQVNCLLTKNIRVDSILYVHNKVMQFRLQYAMLKKSTEKFNVYEECSSQFVPKLLQSALNADLANEFELERFMFTLIGNVNGWFERLVRDKIEMKCLFQQLYTALNMKTIRK